MAVVDQEVTSQNRESQKDRYLSLAVENHITGVPRSRVGHRLFPIAQRRGVHDHGVTRLHDSRDREVLFLGQNIGNHALHH